MGQGQSTTVTPPEALRPSPTAPAQSACPVDHTSREAWLNAAQQQRSRGAPQETPVPPTSTTASEVSDASACPVDHKSREAWMKAAQQQRPQSSLEPNSTPTQRASQAPVRPKLTNNRLSTERQVSSIPRSFGEQPSNSAMASAATTSTPPEPQSQSQQRSTSTFTAHGSMSPSPNAQTASATDIHTSPTGHWVYPSEAMFFSAMARKNYAPRATDMPSIIPIHNAVNEHTWHEILGWERGRGAEACGGPKLVSFEGDAGKLTPRARWNSLLGRKPPFDRHDWVVERCGRRVEYVIDFYEGKMGAGEREKGGVSFYLDVRPKLNSFEGLRMRIERYWGWG